MKRINDIDEFSSLASAKKHRYTNCYLFLDGINALISEGVLYYESVPSGVLFYSDTGSAYDIYYYLSSCEPFAFASKDKPVQMEMASRVGNTVHTDMLALWQSLGFKLRAESLQMQRVFDRNTDFPLPDNGAVYATPENMESIFGLWRDDMLIDVRSNESEYLSDIAASRIITIPGNGSGVRAVLHMEARSGYMLLDRIVVSENYRGQGLMARLLDFAFAQGIQSGRYQFRLWVLKQNTVAQKAYKKRGFEPNGRVAAKLYTE